MGNSIKSLMDLGLSEQEADIYLAALRLDGATASVIAKEEGLKRTTAYPILKSMADKGFINIYFRKNTRHYYAVKPNKIQQQLEKKMSAFGELIPYLNSLSKINADVIGLRFIETANELEQFYSDILSEYGAKKPEAREYYIIGNSVAWEGISEEFFKRYRKDRGASGIRTKLLLSSDSAKINPQDKGLLREYKYCPEKYKFQSTIDIFDSKVLIVSPQLSSLAVVIAVPAMVDIFRSVFEMLWDTM